MCGRYNLRATPSEIAEIFAVLRVPDFVPRYNIAPTQQVLSIRLVEPSKIRQADMLRWGLVPFWSKDPKSGPPLINARADTVRTKPAFRAAFKSRRCLVPMSGFYEWSTVGTTKQPYHIAMKDDRPFAIAGLWESWTGDGKTVESVTMITTDPNEVLQPFHDRMPVVIAPAEYDTWLSGTPDEAADLMKPYDPRAMHAVAVSTVVNNARNETPDCLTPATAP